MSTNSVIAIPDGDAWRGRYVHWDGQPTWMGAQLHAIVQRDGVEQARKVLTETERSWSSIDSGYAEKRDGAYDEVSGYGTAHLDKSCSAWATPVDDDGRWLYVLADDALWIGKVSAKPDFYAVVRYDDTNVDWQAIEYKECGDNYETCGHYAWVHFPQVGQDCRLSTAAWLGREPLTARDCTELTFKGRRYRIGGGSIGGWGKHALDSHSKWFGYLTDIKTGEKRDDIAIYNANTLKPYAGVTFHYPATAVGAS